MALASSRMSWPSSSRQSRNYGRAWEKKRATVLERDARLCQCTRCKAEKRTTIATEVDHIVSRAKAQAQGWSTERTESMENLQAINADCHKRKTIEEQGGTHKPKEIIGLDGFPVTERRGGTFDTKRRSG